jgi:ceramide glucosyltransferase
LNLTFVARVLALLSYVSFGLTLWRWLAVLRFPLHHRAAAPAPLPGCTVLKPLKGCDALTKSCLQTWLAQNYPGPVQFLFGVASADDPVCAVVRELVAAHPGADAQLVVCNQQLGVNSKVSKLRQLEPLIRHPFVVISDADVAVPPDFLSNIAPLFADASVGLVNCFYRLAYPPNETLAMRWETIAMNSDFWSSVLQAQSFQKVDFALGAVMALPLAQLQSVGGFAALADYLADDYHLGQLVAQGGKRIVFSPVVVECHEPHRTWAQVWAHQLRWARTIRACQSLPFFFSILDNATLWPLLWLAFAATLFYQPDTLSITIASISSGVQILPPLAGGMDFSAIVGLSALFFAFRIATALHQEKRLTRSSAHFPWFWMVPVKDLLNAAIWAAAFIGHHIEWRGQRYRILPGGQLQKSE